MAPGGTLNPLPSLDLLAQVLDYIDTFAVAVTGATAGARHGFDLFGVLVLAFATWHYLAIARLAGVFTFRLFHLKTPTFWGMVRLRRANLEFGCRPVDALDGHAWDVHAPAERSRPRTSPSVGIGPGPSLRSSIFVGEFQ